MDQDDEVLVIRGARRKSAASLIGSLGFVLGGWWLFSRTPFPIVELSATYAALVGIVTIGFFGLTLVGALASLIRPGKLYLDREGYTFKGWFLGPKVLWSDVDEFVLTSTYGAKLIEPLFHQTRRKEREPLVRRMLRLTFDGYEFARLDLKTEKLRDVLESWRARQSVSPSDIAT